MKTFNKCWEIVCKGASYLITGHPDRIQNEFGNFKDTHAFSLKSAPYKNLRKRLLTDAYLVILVTQKKLNEACIHSNIARRRFDYRKLSVVKSRSILKAIFFLLPIKRYEKINKNFHRLLRTYSFFCNPKKQVITEAGLAGCRFWEIFPFSIIPRRSLDATRLPFTLEWYD